MNPDTIARDTMMREVSGLIRSYGLSPNDVGVQRLVGRYTLGLISKRVLEECFIIVSTNDMEGGG